MRALPAMFLLGSVLLTALVPPRSATIPSDPDSLRLPGEKHLSHIRQLTFGGENAEAYFSPDDKKLIFQSTRDDHLCDQIYIMNSDGSGVKMVSTGRGRTTCGFFSPDGKRITFSSTHLAGPECPPDRTTREVMSGPFTPVTISSALFSMDQTSSGSL